LGVTPSGWRGGPQACAIKTGNMKLLKELEKNKKDKILGLLLFTLALLLFVSLLSYDFTTDHANINKALANGDYGQLLDGLHNRGGVVGAVIAYLLYSAVGLCAIFIPIGLIAWGGNRFLGRSKGSLIRWMLISAFFILAMMTLSSLLNGMNAQYDIGLTIGGALGHFFAKALLTLFGTIVAWTFMMALIITGLMLIVPSFVRRWSNKIFGPISGLIFKGAKRDMTTDETKTTVAVQDLPLPIKKEGLFARLLRLKKKPQVKKENAPTQMPPAPAETKDIAPVLAPTAADETVAKPQGSVNRIKSIRSPAKKGEYRLPSIDLLDDSPAGGPIVDESYYRKTAEALRHTLLTFGVEIEAGEVNIFPGPIITRFEFKPASGIKVSQIVNLADDLALAMQAERIRIVAPIPGKPAVGIEIPNKIKRGIYIKEIISSPAFTDSDAKLLIALGKTISGEPYTADLARMPHLLIAGSTGSGKSVCLNCLITSLIFRLHPDEIRFILIDPKRLELSVYDGLPHLEKPVITEMKDAEKILADAVFEMEDRYRRLARAGVRNIAEFNSREKDVLPYLVIIVDELADLMMSGLNRVESLITRLAQMARAVGIHLVLATQRPSVDVITGLIKANFSTRIAFQTASKVDSRTILDANGAEKLLGRGDMLFSSPGFADPMRIHGALITGGETDRLVEFISQQEYRTRPIEVFEKSVQESIPGFDPASDALFKEAIELVIRHKQGSVSLLQRRLGIGYQRAARLIDQLEQAGIVGPYDGSKAREVLVDETYLESKEYNK
jgi:S-DNA-T family DNA segregation ATPase FtsK/SpoIIIE